jgi:hypothetical protein
MFNLSRVAVAAFLMVSILAACGKSSSRSVVGNVTVGGGVETDASTPVDPTQNCIQWAKVTTGSGTLDQLEFYNSATCSPDGSNMVFSMKLTNYPNVTGFEEAYGSDSTKPSGAIQLTNVANQNGYNLLGLCQLNSDSDLAAAIPAAPAALKSSCTVSVNAKGQITGIKYN